MSPPTNAFDPAQDRASTHPPGQTSDAQDEDVDRRAIRRARAPAAKLAKKIVRARFDEIARLRPVGSQPADKVLARAVDLYADGPLRRQDLKAAVVRLEARLRRDVPDLVVIRPPRTVSAKPERVGLMLYETRAMEQDGDKLVSAVNHSIVLTERSIAFVSGLLPGGTRPHLFERTFERGVRHRTLAAVQMNLSILWPTLIWMRNEQRRSGRGAPHEVMMTPYEGGLLFGTFFKVEGLPPGGPIVSIVAPSGQQTRTLRDHYGNEGGDRVWAMTNTYVDGELLSAGQRRLAAKLEAFTRDFADVVAEDEWRWRVGLGESDPAVTTVADLFGLAVASEDRRGFANAALEAIVSSPEWREEAARTIASQAKSTRSRDGG